MFTINNWGWSEWASRVPRLHLASFPLLSRVPRAPEVRVCESSECAYVYTQMYLCMPVCAHMSVCSVCLHMCVHECRWCVCVRMYLCVPLCMCVHACIWCVRLCVCMCKCIYIHPRVYVCVCVFAHTCTGTVSIVQQAALWHHCHVPGLAPLLRECPQGHTANHGPEPKSSCL